MMKRRQIITPALAAKLRARDKALFEKMITQPSEVRLDLLLDALEAAWALEGSPDERDLP